MKSSFLILGGLAIAAALSLSSCGEADPSAEKADDRPGTPQAAGSYPLKVCVVSGEELGSMGKPVVIDHEGTEVRFCCKNCIPDFKKEPDKYLAKLKAGQAGGNQ